MKILIDPRSNTLHDLVEDDRIFPVALPLFWQTTPEPNFNPRQWTWDGVDFVPIIPSIPVSDGREQARAAARLAVVNKIIDDELAKPSSDIPEIETLRTALGGR